MKGSILQRLIQVSIVAAIATMMLGFTVGIAGADAGGNGRGQGNKNAHGQVGKQSHNFAPGWNRVGDDSQQDDDENDDSNSRARWNRANDNTQGDDENGKDDSRPGWGWGDRNHEHFGPPGQDCDDEDGCEEARGAPSVVSNLAATHFTVSAPSSATSGTAFNFRVWALDQNNDRTSNYSGTVHFSSTDGSASLPGDVTLSDGAGTFSATLRTTGNQTITATDTGTSSIVGNSGNIFVSSGATTHFVVSAPSNATSGRAFSFTVRALDANNQRDYNYNGTVHFTSSDGSAALPADTALTSGRGSFTATLATTGNQNITATDVSNSAIVGTSGNIAVSAATGRHLVLSEVPSSATAGTAFNFRVTAKDANNNVITDFADTIHFTSSDGSAVRPDDSTLSNGTGTFSVTLKTAGSQTISVSDASNSGVAGASASVPVTAAGLHHLVVSAPNSATSGTAFDFTVTAQDEFNNTATGYNGTVNFSSSDSEAVLPLTNTSLYNGTGTFTATLKTAGSQTITATDASNSSITDASGAIAVSAAGATRFVVTAPTPATAGSAFNFTVTAKDLNDNIVTSYSGTVHFTSTDGLAQLPADSTLTNGTGTFSATLRTAGNRTITATDTANASLTAASGTIAVSPAAATHFAVSAPPSAGNNVPFNFTVTALDQFNNTATSYAGTVHFTSTGSADLPANSTLTNGTKSFSATLKTAGSQTITATDTVTASITGTSATITVP